MRRLLAQLHDNAETWKSDTLEETDRLQEDAEQQRDVKTVTPRCEMNPEKSASQTNVSMLVRTSVSTELAQLVSTVGPFE